MGHTDPIESSSGEIDYDLHEIVGVRVIGASPAEAAAVDRQLGPTRARLERPPDVLLRFVPRLETPKGLRQLGVRDAAFGDDAFYVLRGRHKAPVRVRIPFDQIGKGCEIVCERGIERVPLLIPILNLCALGRGFLPLHASAFSYRGVGVIATGWSKGGKTETLLAFMARGAEYVADEWLYVAPDGQRMYGMPEPLTLWDWHLRQVSRLAALVPRQSRVRLAALGAAAALLRGGGALGGSMASAARRIAGLVDRQRFVRVSPERLFGAGFGYFAGMPRKLIFVASHAAPDITVRPVDPRDVAERMVHSLHAERAEFLSYYSKFRFAFPQLENEIVERASQTERELLDRVFADKEAFAVYHPHPVSFSALFDSIRPLLEEPESRCSPLH